MEAALGRILDVDIAAETTNLAKQQILVQASMVAQANSANQVALTCNKSMKDKLFNET